MKLIKKFLRTINQSPTVSASPSPEPPDFSPSPSVSSSVNPINLSDPSTTDSISMSITESESESISESESESISISPSPSPDPYYNYGSINNAQPSAMAFGPQQFMYEPIPDIVNDPEYAEEELVKLYHKLQEKKKGKKPKIITEIPNEELKRTITLRKKG